MGIFTESKRFERSSGRLSRYSGQCIGTFALEFVEIAPFQQMLERYIRRLENDINSIWVTDKPKIKNNVLVQIVPIF